MESMGYPQDYVPEVIRGASLARNDEKMDTGELIEMTYMVKAWCNNGAAITSAKVEDDCAKAKTATFL